VDFSEQRTALLHRTAILKYLNAMLLILLLSVYLDLRLSLANGRETDGMSCVI